MKYYIDFLLLVIINAVVVCLLKLSPTTKQKTDNNNNIRYHSSKRQYNLRKNKQIKTCVQIIQHYYTMMLGLK